MDKFRLLKGGYMEPL